MLTKPFTLNKRKPNKNNQRIEELKIWYNTTAWISTIFLKRKEKKERYILIYLSTAAGRRDKNFYLNILPSFENNPITFLEGSP